MNDLRKTKAQLAAEVARLRSRVAELETAEAARQRAEDALRQSEASLRALLNAVDDSMMLIEPDGEVVAVNTTTAARLNTTPAVMLGRNAYDFVSSEVTARRRMYAAQTIATGQPARFVDERYGRWIDNSIYPVIDAQGCVVRLAIFGRDITKYRQTEEVLRHRKAELSTALRLAQLGHWQYEVASDTFTFNDEFYALLHTTTEQEGGYTMSATRYAQRFVHQDDRPVVGREIQAALDTLDPHYRHQVEHRIIYADGTPGYFSVLIQVEKDAQGRTVRTHGVNQDITVRKQIEAQREAALEALRQSEASLRAIFENSQQSFVLFDRSRRVQALNRVANERAKLIYGRDIHPGDSIYEFMQPQARANFDQLFERGLASEAIQFERMFAPDGAQYWYEYHITPVRTGDGDTTGVFLSLLDITERKQAEAALRESEDRFRSLLQTIPTVAVQGYQMDGTTHYWNAASERLYGYTAAQALGRNLVDLIIPPEMRDGVQQAMRQMAETGQPIPASELSLIRQDGSRVAVFSSHAIVQPLGRAPELFCLDIDLSERKQAEAALRANELFVKGVLDSLTAHIAVLDEHGTIVTVNAAWQNFAHDNNSPVADAYLGVNYLAVCEAACQRGDEVAREVTQGIRSVLTGSQAQFSTEYRCATPTRPRWFTLLVLPLYQARPGAVVIHQDITERKQSEVALRANRDYLQAVLDAANDAVFVDDADTGEIIDVNQRMCELYGYTHEEALRTPIGDLSQGEPPYSQAEALAWLSKARESGPQTFEWHAKRKDGQLFWAEVSIRFAMFGQDARFVVTMRDITERQRAAEAAALKNKHLTLLNQLGQSLSKLASRTEILERLSELIGQVFDNRNLYIAVYDEATNLVSFPVYWVAGERKGSVLVRPLSNGLTEFVILMRRPVLIADHVAEALAEHSIALIGTPCQCYLGVPIQIGERVVGVIAVQDYERPQVYDASHVELLSTIASQAAIAFENARLYETVQQELAERKQAEEALRDSEERFRLAFDTSPDAININRLTDGLYVDINQGFTAQTGFTREDAIGKTSAEINIWHDPADRQKLVHSLLTTGYCENLEAQFRRKDGSPTTALMSARVISLQGVPHILSITRDISERKRVEEALQASERQLHLIADNMPAVVNYVDARTLRYRFVNRGYADLFGLVPEQIIGKQVCEIMDASAYQQALPYIERARAGERVRYENLVPSRGGPRWFSVSYEPDFDEHGSNQNIIVLAVDITERKQAIEQIKRYEFIANAATEFMTLINQQHVLEAVNDAYCRAQGRSRGDLIGRSLVEIWGEARYRDKIRPYIERCFAGQIVHYEETFAFENGELRDYQVGMYPYAAAPDGSVLYAAIVTFDITQRKQAEQAEHQARQLAEALRDTATALNGSLKLDAVLDQVLINVERVVPHTGSNIMLVDGDVAQVVRVRGRCVTETIGVEQYTISTTANLSAMRVTGEPCIIDRTRDNPDWRTLPGYEWIASYAGVPIYAAGDQLLGYLGLYSTQPGHFSGEHTQRLKIFAAQAALAIQNAQMHTRIQLYTEELEERVFQRTRQLSEANAQLSELDRLKDDFISRISHELRTPLTSIKIYLELLDAGKPEKRARYMQVLTEQTTRLQQLIESLLEVTQQSINTAGLHITPIDLNHLAASLVADSALRANQHGLKLNHTLALDLPLVAADAILLTQALANLVTNALNYTPPGGTIDLSTTQVIDRGETWVTLTIRDSGPGITPADLPHIFDRFYRGRAAADYKTPGAGVGLSISRDILIALEGRLTVDSQPDVGAAFTAWLKPA